jgi:hypothetical protein
MEAPPAPDPMALDAPAPAAPAGNEKVSGGQIWGAGPDPR